MSLKLRWQQWLDRRIPLCSYLELGHRSIFIVPTAFGALFLLLLVVLLLTAINYQSSLIYALVFWLFSLMLVSMLQTFRNLAGLQVQALKAPAGFVGEEMELSLCFSGRAQHEALSVSLNRHWVELDVPKGGEQGVRLSVKPTDRGRLDVPRIRISTLYPFGLFRAWSWVKLDFDAWVYPQPIWHDWLPSQDGGTLHEQAKARQQGGEQDFHGLRNYQAGDSLRRIAWKQLARGKGLVSKEFEAPSGLSLMFRYQDLSSIAHELRLSYLCAWVLEAQQQGWRYGLELPNVRLAQANGAEHLEQCLLALAQQPRG